MCENQLPTLNLFLDVCFCRKLARPSPLVFSSFPCESFRMLGSHFLQRKTMNTKLGNVEWILNFKTFLLSSKSIDSCQVIGCCYTTNCVRIADNERERESSKFWTDRQSRLVKENSSKDIGWDFQRKKVSFILLKTEQTDMVGKPNLKKTYIPPKILS